MKEKKTKNGPRAMTNSDIAGTPSRRKVIDATKFDKFDLKYKIEVVNHSQWQI